MDKSGVLDAATAGSGDLSEFVEEFSDGQVQFGLARVTVPGSDVVKNLLLGWCPDNAPAKLRLSFAANFADVSKVLSGYHVQITARDADDLDVDEFISRVGAAAGARYLIQTASGGSVSKKAAPKPAPTVTSSTKTPPKKPSSFIPASTGKPIAVNPKPVVPKPSAFSAPKAAAKDDDEWGGEKEIEERDFESHPLEDVPSAYKPTKVDIGSLRKQKSDTISSQPKPAAAKPAESAEEENEEAGAPKSFGDRMKAYQLIGDDGRLTSLPKPKVNHSVASRYTVAVKTGPSFGSKPSFNLTPDKKDKLVGGVSRNFASENGKTPAQIWAEKRGQYKEVAHDEEPAHESAPEPAAQLEPKFRAMQVDQEPEEEEPEEEEQEEQEEFKPTIIKPATSFPTPPKRNLPPATEREEEKEVEEEVEEAEQEEEEEEKPAPLPARNLPPLPSRGEPEEEPAPALPKRDEPKEEPKKEDSVSAVAQYDYEKDEDNEVAFSEGDIIIEIEFVDEEWWTGKNSRTGESGLFPGSYVTVRDNSEETEEAAAPATKSGPAAPAASEPEPASEGKTAVAEYDYEKDEDNEISFGEGDLIVEIEFVDEDWWSGKHAKSGDVGLFPANYVKLQ